MQVILYEIDPSFLWLNQNMTTDCHCFNNFVKYVVTLLFWSSKHVNITSISKKITCKNHFNHQPVGEEPILFYSAFLFWRVTNAFTSRRRPSFYWESRLLSAIFFAITLLVLQFHIFSTLIDSFLSENDSFLLENIAFVFDFCESKDESFLQVQFDSL